MSKRKWSRRSTCHPNGLGPFREGNNRGDGVARQSRDKDQSMSGMMTDSYCTTYIVQHTQIAHLTYCSSTYVCAQVAALTSSILLCPSSVPKALNSWGVVSTVTFLRRTHGQRTSTSLSTYLDHASSFETPFRSFQASLSQVSDVMGCEGIFGEQIWLKATQSGTRTIWPCR